MAGGNISRRVFESRPGKKKSREEDPERRDGEIRNELAQDRKKLRHFESINIDELNS